VDKGYSASQKLSDGTNTDTRSADYQAGETYAPTDPSKPKAGGTFTIGPNKPGALTLAHNGTTYRWDWYTNPPLVYDASCKAKTPEGIRAVYTYTNPDGKASRLEITFQSCGSYTVSFEGQVMVP